ncbi:MAG: LLM class flavin-dependent oxidoreductase, partial [Alphaproteobacteria bacterium]
VPFEKRVGCMLEGLRLARALWTGEPVDWDGRWKMSGATVGPTPVRKGGPPIWVGGSIDAALKRTAKEFDGWFPISSPPKAWAKHRAIMDDHAEAAGRSPSDITGALYLTVSLDENAQKADDNLNAFMQNYYGAPPAVMRKMQVCYAGPKDGVAGILQEFADAGVEHICLRFTGDHDANLEAFAKIRQSLGW